MMRSQFLIFVLGLALTVGLVPLGAQDTAPPKAAPTAAKKGSEGDMKALVARLADRDFAVREKADAELRALDSSALPELEKYLEHEDAEVRTRMKAIVESLRKPATSGEEEGKPLQPIEPGGKKSLLDSEDLPRFRDFDSFDDYRRALDEHLAEAQTRGLLGNGGTSIVIEPNGQGATSFRSSKSIFRDGERLSLTQSNAGMEFVIEPRGGDKTRFTARDLETFKKENAEVYERYKATGIFEDNIIRFEVLRPDAAPGDLSEREKASRDRLTRLLDLTEEDPFADFNERFRELIRRQDEMERSLRERLNSLLEHGGGVDPFAEAERLRRQGAPRGALPGEPRLGVVVQLPPANVAAKLDPEKLGASGIRIVELQPGSLAEQIGLKVGDILLRFNTTALNAPADLVAAFKALGEGEKISIGVLRGEESLNCSGLKPKVEEQAERPPTILKKIDPGQLKKF